MNSPLGLVSLISAKIELTKTVVFFMTRVFSAAGRDCYTVGDNGRIRSLVSSHLVPKRMDWGYWQVLFCILLVLVLCFWFTIGCVHLGYWQVLFFLWCLILAFGSQEDGLEILAGMEYSLCHLVLGLNFVKRLVCSKGRAPAKYVNPIGTTLWAKQRAFN